MHVTMHAFDALVPNLFFVLKFAPHNCTYNIDLLPDLGYTNQSFLAQHPMHAWDGRLTAV